MLRIATLLNLLWFLALAPNRCCAQNLTSPLFVSERSDGFVTKEGLIRDLDNYKHTISKEHIQPFKYIKRKAFSRLIDSIKAISASLDADQLLVALMCINAMLRDAHTGVLYIARETFPLYCFWFEEGIFITHSDSLNFPYCQSQIIEINDCPIGDVVKLITSTLPDTGTTSIKKNVHLKLFDPTILHGLGIANNRVSITYKIVSPSNDTIEFQPKSTDVRKIKWRSSSNYGAGRPTDPYWFKYIDTSNVLYFNYSTCYQTETFNSLMQHLKDTISIRAPRKIVVDLRHNSGGYEELLSPFLQFLTTTNYIKKGSIDVLIGRETFSAAIMNTLSFKNNFKATTIGEETAGQSHFYAGVKFTTLPNTLLKVAISTEIFDISKEIKGTLRPDILIPVKFADYNSGIDAQLTHALNR